MLEFVILIIFSGLCVFGAYVGFKERKRVKDEFNEKVELAEKQTSDALSRHKPRMIANYNELRRKLNIPTNCAKIDVETSVFGLKYKAEAPVGKQFLLRNDFYCWNENDTLFIFPTEEHITDKHITYATLPKDLEANLNADDINIISIEHNEMQYFKLSGQERSETKVQSADNGINIKGAVVGGVLAGDAGAVIGSQHNRGQIYSNTVHFDERFVELFYKKDNNTYKLKLSVTAYPLLEKWFPDKEYEFVLSQQQQGNVNTDRFEEVKKYKELLDNGIISNEEFETKKKELLGL